MSVGEIIVEGAILAVAARPLASHRPPVVARPRRGMADLGDRDTTPGGRHEPELGGVSAPAPRERWLFGAAWTVGAVSIGLAVHGALGLV